MSVTARVARSTTTNSISCAIGGGSSSTGWALAGHLEEEVEVVLEVVEVLEVLEVVGLVEVVGV